MIRKLNQYKEDLEVLIEKLVLFILNPESESDVLIELIEKSLATHSQLYSFGLKDLKGYLELKGRTECPHVGSSSYITQCLSLHCLECLKAHLVIKRATPVCPCNLPLSEADIEYLSTSLESPDSQSSFPLLFEGFSTPNPDQKCSWKECEKGAYFACACKGKLFCNDHLTPHITKLSEAHHIPKPLYLSLKQKDLRKILCIKRVIQQTIHKVNSQVLDSISRTYHESYEFLLNYLMNFQEKSNRMIESFDIILSSPLISTNSEHPLIQALLSAEEDTLSRTTGIILKELQPKHLKIEKSFVDFSLRLPTLTVIGLEDLQ